MIPYFVLTLFFVEAALMLYRIKTQSIQRKATAALRGGSVLLLAMLAALFVIEWGVRYYALVLLLVTSSAVHIVQLIKRKSQPEFRHARVVLSAVGMSALIFITSLPAIIFPEYKPLPATGQHQIRSEVKYFSDENRAETYDKSGGARTLAVEFWYPEKAEGSFPLVVFSHGAFGMRTSNETLFRELASHGYVVCSIDHTYHCLYTADETGKTLWIDGGYMRELREEDAKENKQKSLELYQKWMGIRVADIDFVIDTVADRTRSNPSDQPYGLIDIEKIGVIGHSLGGSAALGIGRLRSDIGAVIALEAPFLCDILSVEDDRFVFENAEYPVPVLTIYSDSSWAHLAQWPQYAQNVRLLSGREKNAHNVHIAGTGHLSLTDLSLSSPILTRVLNGHSSSITPEDCLTQLNEACLSFFNRFVKNEPPEVSRAGSGAASDDTH